MRTLGTPFFPAFVANKQIATPRSDLWWIFHLEFLQQIKALSLQLLFGLENEIDQRRYVLLVHFRFQKCFFV